jgi:hypothetical protein
MKGMEKIKEMSHKMHMPDRHQLSLELKDLKHDNLLWLSIAVAVIAFCAFMIWFLRIS